MMRKSLIAGLLALCVSPLSQADVNNDLNTYFSRLGFEGNATQAQAWQGQAAGYATGGSLFLRNQVKNIQLMSFSPPSLTAGCGGIDSFFGSYSYINSEQLEAFIKNMMSNATGYFFDLALQTVAPELKDAKDFLQKIAQDVNSTNISSCQAAQGIIGGLWPKTQVSQQKVCQDIAGESNIFADWAASRQGCTVGGSMNSVLSRASGGEKDRVLKNKNLMWEILSRNELLSSDKQMKELVMNLTGTLIFGKDGNVSTLVPKADHQDLIHALMEGGTMSLQTCTSSTDCLQLTTSQVSVSEDRALVKKVRDIISSIRSKLGTDEPLSATEKGFIQSTSIPVMRYLVDPMQLSLNTNMLASVSDYIAYDILQQYLKELIDQARMQMASRNFDQEVMDSLNANIRTASAQLDSLQRNVQVKSDALTEMERQMAYLRQQTSSQLLERYEQNYRFGTSGGL